MGSVLERGRQRAEKEVRSAGGGRHCPTNGLALSRGEGVGPSWFAQDGWSFNANTWKISGQWKQVTPLEVSQADTGENCAWKELDQWFSNGGDFGPRGHLAIPGNTFGGQNKWYCHHVGRD